MPLGGVKEVQAIRIDGSRRALDASGESLTLTIGEDPLLLLYDGGENALPPSLGAPLAALNGTRNGSEFTLVVTPNGTGPSALALIAPPFWTVKKSVTGSGVQIQFSMIPPPATSAREADFTVTFDGQRGELYFRAPVAK